MRIVIKGRNIEVTSAMRDYVTKRLGKLEKLINEMDESEVTLQVTLLLEKDRHRVEVTVPLHGYILRGEEETGDMYSSIDLVMEKLEKQTEKYRSRISKKARNQNLRGLPVMETETVDDEPRILRTKRFNLKPMPVEEAVVQMNLLGHTFFVFANDSTEEVNVIYRRRDGNYGLIAPEM